MIIKQLAAAVGLAALMLAAAGGLRWAEHAGMVQADEARRIVQVLIGLMLAGYANMMPKQLGRPNGSPDAEARAQAALRLGGWLFMLAGLAYAVLWAFAPLPLADIAGTTVVAAALAATLANTLRSFAACRSARTDPAGR